MANVLPLPALSPVICDHASWLDRLLKIEADLLKAAFAAAISREAERATRRRVQCNCQDPQGHPLQVQE
jgi:hypothetical protein